MKNYYNSLVDSFDNFDAVKSLPTFAKDIQQIQKDLAKMHTIIAPTQNIASNSKTPSEAPVITSASNTVVETPISSNETIDDILPESTPISGVTFAVTAQEANQNISKNNEIII